MEKTLPWEPRMREQAKQAVLPEMRKAEQIAAVACLPVAIVRRNLHQWREEGRIFFVEDEGIEYFPLFALDPNTHYKPYSVVAEILEIFQGLSPLGIASWFVGMNSFLDDQRPQDILKIDPEWVIDAAKDEFEECQHG